MKRIVSVAVAGFTAIAPMILPPSVQADEYVNYKGVGYRVMSAYVFDPPSNIRVRSKGAVLCVVSNKQYIKVLEPRSEEWRNWNGWYMTDFCGGQVGFIHKSQVGFD